MSQTKAYIYGLFDSTGCRYIGKARNCITRFRGHLFKSGLKQVSYKNNWIKSLLAQGKQPEMHILEECGNEGVAFEREMWWISFGKRMGWNLTNGTDGGEGVISGYKHSEGTKAKIVSSLKGRACSLETRAKISAANKGRKLPEERIAKLKNDRIGFKHTDEAKAKISVASRGHKYNIGRKASLETKAKMAAAHRGKKCSEETKAKIGAANRKSTIKELTCQE